MYNNNHIHWSEVGWLYTAMMRNQDDLERPIWNTQFDVPISGKKQYAHGQKSCMKIMLFKETMYIWDKYLYL